jgi:hypothetical protein
LTHLQATLTTNDEALANEVAEQAKGWEGAARDNEGLTAARVALQPLADRCRDLTKQIDLAAKLAGRVIEISVKDLDARETNRWANRNVTRARKALETARAEAVEMLRRARYFERQADWLHERFTAMFALRPCRRRGRRVWRPCSIMMQPILVRVVRRKQVELGIPMSEVVKRTLVAWTTIGVEFPLPAEYRSAAFLRYGETRDELAGRYTDR